MIKPKVPIAHEGYPFIGLSSLSSLISACADFPGLAFLFLLLTFFVAYFFRDPERVRPCGKDAICSPADGRVIRVDKVHDDRFCQDEVYKISIFMNVFDVHVNRAPVAGTVKDIQYKTGLFLSADTELAGMENEHCALILETKEGMKVVMVQIAGLIARRIVCWAEKHDVLELGQRMGLIRFGSRVDLYLPLNSRIAVKVGQKVRAGESVIGIFSREQGE